MEDVVPGSKRTISFWRPKPRLLSLERALAAVRSVGAIKDGMTVPALAVVRARGRLQAESKKKGRFAEG